MKQKLRLFVIHQTTASLQWTNYLNPLTRGYLALDESNRMKSGCFIIHPGKNPPPQNGCQLKSDFFQKNTGFTSSTSPSQPDFSQNQPVAITLNTVSPRTLWLVWTSLYHPLKMFWVVIQHCTCVNLKWDM